MDNAEFIRLKISNAKRYTEWAEEVINRQELVPASDLLKFASEDLMLASQKLLEMHKQVSDSQSS